ncbi:MAG: hypothetical protein GF418_10285 [Chitinivibrionales bacterium]|nr:hypothetical protein [Chitinivibrionales bacterium]MBD3396001.1 hypothetical protein [Chitinivibrionales bacterium]
MSFRGGTLKYHWYNENLRIVQILLVEPDAVGLDPKAVVKYLKDAHANCLVINGGGIVDFFANDLELANPNPFMKGDILAQVAEECKKSDIRVIARVDFRGGTKSQFDKHPDWFVVDCDGKPRTLGYTTPPLYWSCYNGKYRNVYGESLIRALLDRYPIDGIWYNSVHSEGPCYCAACAEKYREATGEDIPRVPNTQEDYAGPEMARYRQEKEKSADEFLSRTRDVVKSHGDDKAFAAEVFGMYNVATPQVSGIDLYMTAGYFDFLLSVAFAGTDKSISYPGSIVRFLKSLNPDKEAIVLTGTNRNSHRYAMENAVELKTWCWEAVGAGGGLWNAVIGGQSPDKARDTRNAHLLDEHYSFQAESSALLAGLEPVAEVKLFYSQPTKAHFPQGFGSAVRGAERVLVENHYQYSFVPDINFSESALSGVKVLVLPDVAALSGEHIDVIREYVQGGGNLIASSRTSLFDENGASRSDFGLADALGCSFTGEEKDTRANGYQLIRRRHEIVKSGEGSDVLLNGGHTLLCTIPQGSSAEAICTMTPDMTRQPPEKSWLESWETDYPTMVVNEFGNGKVVFFPHQIFQLCEKDGHDDFTQVIKDTLDYLLGGARLIETNAPPSAHVCLTRSRRDNKSCVLSITNTTSAPSRPIEQIVPLSNIKVSARIGTVKESSVLTPQSDVLVKSTGKNAVSVDIPRLEDFVSLHIQVG